MYRVNSAVLFFSPPGAVPPDSEGALFVCLSGVQVLARSLLRLSVLEANRPQWPTTSEFLPMALYVECLEQGMIRNNKDTKSYKSLRI